MEEKTLDGTKVAEKNANKDNPHFMLSGVRYLYKSTNIPFNENKMKHPILKTGLLAAVMFLFAGCSDVPLSWSTTLSDQRLLGFWQVSDDEIFQIRKNDNGTISMVNYEYDKDTKTYVQAEGPSTIYFTTITDKDLSCQFISIETSYQETKCYLSS